MAKKPFQIVHLDEAFCPQGEYSLIRLGSARDGGYVVDKESVANSDILISLGVGIDWNFEKDFYRLNAVPIEAFDGTVNIRKIIQNIIKAPPDLRSFFRHIKALIGYILFFRNEIRHNKVMVGFSMPPGFLSFQEIIEHYTKGKKKIFLKMDIEGSEYRILEDIIKYKEKIEGLAIEFHDLDLHLEKVKRFISKLSMFICHCHSNNSGISTTSGTLSVTDQGLPLSIELSLTKTKPFQAWKGKLPHPLDKQNGRKEIPHKIKFVKSSFFK